MRDFIIKLHDLISSDMPDGSEIDIEIYASKIEIADADDLPCIGGRTTYQNTNSSKSKSFVILLKNKIDF